MLLVGCPVYDRAWILPAWFDRIERQTYPLEDMGFLFVASSQDRETLDVLFEFQARHPGLSYFNVVMEESFGHATNREPPMDNPRMYKRNWRDPKAIERMVGLRTTLMSYVREVKPRKFFSLDSDILLEDPTTIEQLDTLTDSHDAVNPLAYMSEHSFHPSVMTWREYNGAAYRESAYPLGSLFEADIIMAAVMMSGPVYRQVDYGFHRLGEDLAWSYNAREAGFHLWCASHIYASHILSKKMFTLYNAFGDARRPRKTVLQP